MKTRSAITLLIAVVMTIGLVLVAGSATAQLLCGSSGAPQCDGQCPLGMMCASFAGGCQCIPGPTPTAATPTPTATPVAPTATATPETIDANARCLSAKIKTEGKGAAAYTGCYSKGAAKGGVVDSECLTKASFKITAAFGKLDSKGGCITTDDGVARDLDTAAFASANSGLVGSAIGKCDAVKQKLVGKYVAGIAGCSAKAPGTVDIICTGKVQTKFFAGVTKAEFGIDCSHTAQGAALQAAADLYLKEQICLLAPGSGGCVVAPFCGNGLNDPGEKCDASAPSAGWAVCGPDFACVACNCACPTKVSFTGNASAPESVLDIGWTGIAHRNPIVSDGTTSLTLSCGASSRPCGVCPVSGPVANGPGQIPNQRCTNDTSIKCTTNTPCLAGGGTCQFFFGSNLALATGGVSFCVVDQFNGPVSGTANVETGEAFTVANLIKRIYTGVAIDNPCARCVGDTTKNDGVLGGTCSGGTRMGLFCDGNGTVPGRPDFGTTSLDCPLALGALIAALPIDLSNATAPVTKTLSASSPACTGAPGERCLCDTCNNLAATPCDSDADCVAVGATVCGGRRCLGGTNAGAPCVNTTECPGGICGRLGVTTAPSSCLDDTVTTPTALDCVDGGNGEGTCTVGPSDHNCSVASGHAQRGCLIDGDCGGGAGSCVNSNRNCFLTGGFTGTKLGTNTLIAVGMADAPMADTSNPTIGAVFCVRPTGSSLVDSVWGLPGPGRTTIKGAASGHP